MERTKTRFEKELLPKLEKSNKIKFINKNNITYYIKTTDDKKIMYTEQLDHIVFYPDYMNGFINGFEWIKNNFCLVDKNY